jgi:hypothetical protein
MIVNGALSSTGKAHITVIPGAPRIFQSMKGAWQFAKVKGFNGGMQCFMGRVNSGLPWEEVIKPVSAAMHEHGLRRAARSDQARKRKRAEMHDICAEIDRRKAEIASG